MDEQQMIQLLNQIPLEVLQNYVAQRTQQEQAAAQTAVAESRVPQETIPQGAVPQEQVPVMARGGRLGFWTPYVDPYFYSCGGHTRTTVARGRMGARKKRY